jgi:hypothetical protein
MSEGLNFKIAAVFRNSGTELRTANCDDIVQSSACLCGISQSTLDKNIKQRRRSVDF